MNKVSVSNTQWKTGDRIIINYGKPIGIWIATVTMIRQENIYFIFDYEPAEKDSCSITSKNILGKGLKRKRKSAIPENDLSKYMQKKSTSKTKKTRLTGSKNVEKNDSITSNEADEFVILDFETTGLSPDYERIIEVGAVIVKGKKVVKEFSQLMNPGLRIPHFITELTGISNAMIKNKPTPEKTMKDLKSFVGNRTILAHNASFDAKFFHAEMKRAKCSVDNEFLCTLMLSRRLITGVENYKLQTLVRQLDLVKENKYKSHRALDDVIMTSKLWHHLQDEVSQRIGVLNPDISIFHSINKKPKKNVSKYLSKISVN